MEEQEKTKMEENIKNKEEIENNKKQDKKENKSKNSKSCNDIQCPFHGILSARGRVFRGTVIKKFPRRITIEFERTIYIRKYERYLKKKTKIHARLPDCMKDEINVGDYIEVRECRPLSKIIHFVVMKNIRASEIKEKLK